MGLIVITIPGSAPVDDVVAHLTGSLHTPGDVSRVAEPSPTGEPLRVLLVRRAHPTTSDSVAPSDVLPTSDGGRPPSDDDASTSDDDGVVIVVGAPPDPRDRGRQRAAVAAALARAAGRPCLVVAEGTTVSGADVADVLRAGFGPDAPAAVPDLELAGSAPPDGDVADLVGFHPVFVPPRWVGHALAQLLTENDGLRAALRSVDAETRRLAREVERERRHALAAEAGAADVAAHFEEFRDRRLVRLATTAADRFYPVLAGLAGRHDTTEHDAAIERLRTGPLAARTGLGAAVRAGALAAAPTVVIPVYNARDAVERCLASVAANSPADTNVVLVHDASTDPAVAPLLSDVAARNDWTLLTNPENLGFTRTVNRGLAAAPAGDVVILNADTRVPRRWLWRLRHAAHAEPRVGTVTPLSDSAGRFSFDSPRPEDLAEVDRFATAVARAARFERPGSPTANGFCMYVTAAAREVVPLLDEENFPRGYGEENDYCMRLSELGFSHVVADDVVVFHDESASFGPEKEALLAAGLETLDRLWPDYHERAARFVASDGLRRAREAAADAVATAVREGPRVARRRVLAVVHDGFGGTQNHVDDLARHLDADHETWTLVPEYTDVAVRRFVDGRWETVHRWHPVDGWQITQMTNEDRFDTYVDLLSRLDIDVVHVHHLLGQTFDLVDAARALGIGVVMTAHDYYLACPSLNLLDERGEFCGGTCTPGDGPCPTIERWVPAEFPLKHRFVRDWQAATRVLLDSIDVVAAPSQAAIDVLAGVHGDAVTSRARVIPHGTETSRRGSVARAPDPDAPVRVVVVGVLVPHKGSEVLRAVVAADRREELDIGVLGIVDSDHVTAVADLPVTFHGGYRRVDLARRLERIRPAFVAVLSPWPETFSFVVSEAWSLGIPVVVGDLGAPAERVRAHGGGIVVDLADPAAVVESVVAAGHDRDRWERLAAEAASVPLRSAADMAADHAAMYDEVCGVHR